MGEFPFAFPVIGFAAGQTPENPSCFFGEEFSWVSPRVLSGRLGMILVDLEGRCWKVSRVVDLGRPGPPWRRAIRFLLGDRQHRIEQEFIELPPMSFDEVKARVCEDLWDYPGDWRDDQDIAGKDIELRTPEAMLDELKDRVREARSISQLINVLWDQDFPD